MATILEQVEAHVAIIETEAGSVRIQVGPQMTYAFHTPEAAQSFAKEMRGVDYLPSAEERLAMYYPEPYDLY